MLPISHMMEGAPYMVPVRGWQPKSRTPRPRTTISPYCLPLKGRERERFRPLLWLLLLLLERERVVVRATIPEEVSPWLSYSDGSFVNEPILRSGSFIGTMRAGSRLKAKRLFSFMFNDFFFLTCYYKYMNGILVLWIAAVI